MPSNGVYLRTLLIYSDSGNIIFKNYRLYSNKMLSSVEPQFPKTKTGSDQIKLL